MRALGALLSSPGPRSNELGPPGRATWKTKDVPRLDGANGDHMQRYTLAELAGQKQGLCKRQTRINIPTRTTEAQHTRMSVLHDRMVDLRDHTRRGPHDNTVGVASSNIQDRCLGRDSLWGNRGVDCRSFPLARNCGGNASTNECAYREHCRVDDSATGHPESQFVEQVKDC